MAIKTANGRRGAGDRVAPQRPNGNRGERETEWQQSRGLGVHSVIYALGGGAIKVPPALNETLPEVAASAEHKSRLRDSIR